MRHAHFPGNIFHFQVVISNVFFDDPDHPVQEFFVGLGDGDIFGPEGNFFGIPFPEFFAGGNQVSDPDVEYFFIKRFGDVIVGPGFKTFSPEHIGRAGCEQYDRNMAGAHIAFDAGGKAQCRPCRASSHR